MRILTICPNCNTVYKEERCPNCDKTEGSDRKTD